MDRVDALRQQVQRFLIVIIRQSGRINPGGLHRQRTIHVHRKIGMPLEKVLLLDYAHQIQQLLRPSNGKGRNDHIAAPVKGILHDRRQLAHIIRPLAVKPVTIGGFDDHIVRVRRKLRISNQGAALVSKVAGEQQCPLFFTLHHLDVNTGGP